MTANNYLLGALNGNVDQNGNVIFNKESVKHNIGFEWSMDADIHLTKNWAIFSGASIFWWDDEMKKFFGDDDMATNFLGGIQFKF